MHPRPPFRDQPAPLQGCADGRARSAPLPAGAATPVELEPEVGLGFRFADRFKHGGSDAGR
jgi:hypothetical protein